MTKAISLTEKGIIVATREARVAGWIGEYLIPCIGNHHALRYATNEDEFDVLAELPRVAMAFIEEEFFGDEIIARLDFLGKQHSELQVILFSVSDTQPEDSGRYMCWGADSFISLRDSPEQVQEQIKVILKGLNTLSADVLLGIREYNRFSVRPPHFAPREIEIIRCIAQEKTIKETAEILGIREHTVTNYLHTMYRKCGVSNMVGLVKAGLTVGILMVSDLLIYKRTEFGGSCGNNS